MTLFNKVKKFYPSARLVVGTFLLSLILNLFLVGVLVGHGAKHKTFALVGLEEPHAEDTVAWMTRYLDAGDAALFKEVVQSHMDALKQAHAHAHQAKSDVATVFEMERQDPAVLTVALDKLGKAHAEVEGVVGAIVQDSATKLSPEGRRHLAALTR